MNAKEKLKLGRQIHESIERKPSQLLMQGLMRTPLGGIFSSTMTQGFLDAFDGVMETMEELKQIDLKPERKMKSKKWWRRRNKSHWYFHQTLEKGREKYRSEHPLGIDLL